jgi:hypothetical protein
MVRRTWYPVRYGVWPGRVMPMASLLFDGVTGEYMVPSTLNVVPLYKHRPVVPTQL